METFAEKHNQNAELWDPIPVDTYTTQLLLLRFRDRRGRQD